MVTIKQLDLEKGAVKVGQTQSNLIDGLDTTRLGENHIQILIIEIEKYGDICVGKIWDQLDDQIEKT